MVESTGAKAVVILLDAKDKGKFAEAADILYDLLSDIEIIDQEIPILVACNKQDLAFSKNALQIERELTNEIEQIRKVRKATQQQDHDTANQAEDIEEEDQQQSGYLESLKGKFSFEQVPNKIQFTACSVKDDSIDEVLRFITEYA